MLKKLRSRREGQIHPASLKNVLVPKRPHVGAAPLPGSRFHCIASKKSAWVEAETHWLDASLVIDDMILSSTRLLQ